MAGTQFVFPHRSVKSCLPTQWNDGVLTAQANTPLGVPPVSPPQTWHFDDVPLGLAPDGSGGTFVLSVANEFWPWSQGPPSVTHISSAGVTGPTTLLSDLNGWVGVIGPSCGGAIVASGPRHCILVWIDGQFERSKILAQRFDTSGVRGWNPDPIVAGTDAPSWGSSVAIVAEPDVSDGVIAAWYAADNISNRLTGPVRVQRISSDGVSLFGTDGLIVGQAAVSNPAPGTPFGPASWLQLVADQQGGGLVLWANEAANGADYVVQKFSGAGAVLGGPVTVASQVPNGLRSAHKVRRGVSDGTNGLFFAYADAAGLLRVARCSAAPDVLWSVSVTTLTNPMAFDIHEDGSGGILLATISTNILPYLTVSRMDAAGNVTWANQTAIEFLLPRGALLWPTYLWADLVKVVPDGSGGALVVFQAWQRGIGFLPRLYFACFDSQGKQVAPAQAVTGRDTRQYSHVAIASGRGSATVAWADSSGSVTGLDVWTQRIGCCTPQGIDPEPISPCAIVEQPGLPYGQLPINFPCGNRESQYGVIPLSQLAVLVPGIDVPGSLANRAAQPPDWMRITFWGLPAKIQVELQTSKGKVAAVSMALKGSDKIVVGATLTLRPPAREDEFLVFSHKGPPMKDATVIVGVRAQWGDGEAPPLPGPPKC